ncbi:MAG: hypothetical protein R2706_04785 [Acidimicrobiales bacterium]
MIICVVRFALPTPMDLETARATFGQSAASYLDVPGLLFKSYLRAEDGLTVGGVYWWADRASAEARYNEGWLAGVTDKYGVAPQVEWFDAPVAVDPIQQMIRVTPPTRQTPTHERP